jgi:hypothetical protein
MGDRTMRKIFALRTNLKKFHQDERGLEALQVVMIIAVAAIIMLLVKSNYKHIKEWMEDLVTSITNWKTQDSKFGD